jgi:hypothetical protein
MDCIVPDVTNEGREAMSRRYYMTTRLVRATLLIVAALALGPLGTAGQAEAQGGPALGVNAGAGLRSISPNIYGMNYPAPALAAELGMTVQRWGGNSTTRYNWQANVHNTGSDYYFENIPTGSAAGAQLPGAAASNAFIGQGRAAGPRSLITVPTIGWVARADSPREHPFFCSYRQAGQDSYDPFDAPCGSGTIGGALIGTSDPIDTSSPVGPGFVQGWVQHLVGRYGRASDGGVPYYALDNEPGLWHETHRDVHPSPATFQELYDKATQYASAIKAADPSALVLGPVQDGWTRYIYASYLNGAQANADRAANGGVDFVPWYLGRLRQHEQQHGLRLLDYLDLHYYPQADGVALSPAGDAATQALRLRSTAALWDPAYKDESWISTTEPGGVAVQLIPRMRQWIAASYPGTRIAISEYNWGALDSVNGALAQADVLGIFGREGVDLATLWDPPMAGQAGAFAFRMFRNYDGQGGAFGGTSLAASSADQGRLAIYAALRRPDGALTIVVINKTGGGLTSTIGLAGFSPAGAAEVYRYSAASPGAVVRGADVAVGASGLSVSFPASSITTLVIDPADPPAERVYMPLLRR